MGCLKLQTEGWRFIPADSADGTPPSRGAGLCLNFPKGKTSTYDDDGNCTSAVLNNSQWTLAFNAENRLIKATSGTTTLEFKYDYKGRRVEKKVIENGTTTKHEYFVYDGYKQIEKLDALNSNAVVQKFVWNGEKILSVNNGTDTYYYTRDANKNVSELIDATGNVVAHYEYSPFGKLTVSTGTYADDNPFRFSSEYADNETGLVYYNHRYYSPELGRWLSRDPIEEKGGYNLYAMVGNDPVGGWDWGGTGEITTIFEIGRAHV